MSFSYEIGGAKLVLDLGFSSNAKIKLEPLSFSERG